MPRYLDPLDDGLRIDLTETVPLAELVEAPTQPAAPSGITGTIAAVNANDTATASGQIGSTGTIARTNANDAGAASGQVGTSSTIAASNADDTATITGQIGTSGTVAQTNANDTSNASGDAGTPTPAPEQGGAARPRMRYERIELPSIEDELEEIALALLLLV